MLTVVLYVQYLELIVSHLLTIQFAEKGKMLSFETVRDATCSLNADERRIRKEIRGLKDEVDSFIKTFKKLGRFTKGVQFNLDHGMSLRHLMNNSTRQRFLKMFTACTAWGFWWMTDLIGKHFIVEGYVMIVSAWVALSGPV